MEAVRAEMAEIKKTMVDFVSDHTAQTAAALAEQGVVEASQPDFDV